MRIRWLRTAVDEAREARQIRALRYGGTTVSLRKDVEAFVAQVRGHLPSAADDALDLCRHGEWGLAFENLLSNLHDQSVQLTAQELSAADAISNQLEMSRMTVEALRGVGFESDGRPRATVFTLAYCKTTQQLQDFLNDLFELPTPAKYNWDHFQKHLQRWRSMPHALKVWGWDVFAATFPEDAYRLLAILCEAHTGNLTRVELFSGHDVQLDLQEEHGRLELLLATR